MGTAEAHIQDRDSQGAESPREVRTRTRAWRRLRFLIPFLADHEGQLSARAPEEPEQSSSSRARFVGFDEQRHYGKQGRADIVFGPDMFDPRTENGARPLSKAVEEGNSEISPEDFDKTVGEVLGEDVGIDEVTRVSLHNARSIEVSPADGDH